ncbi:hypothetical protein CBR_g4053 [Chara braunii]|uniref:Uncharacterized protein n=1 Tax=Chara braunii TaxID=69332 RepID=A0A388KH41_CHABU|nr:hypothetical protein CBR_g4053 [Chara braunii]|eukprot:GBG69359.1 hypothetical protein CBR_g4053 [Chara braunii]
MQCVIVPSSSKQPAAAKRQVMGQKDPDDKNAGTATGSAKLSSQKVAKCTSTSTQTNKPGVQVQGGRMKATSKVGAASGGKGLVKVKKEEPELEESDPSPCKKTSGNKSTNGGQLSKAAMGAVKTETSSKGKVAAQRKTPNSNGQGAAVRELSPRKKPKIER